MYYLFKSELEANQALDYINQVGLSLFPPERVAPDGLISINALTGLPDLSATKTISWDVIRKKEWVGWYFAVPTEKIMGMALPELEVPGDFTILSQEELDRFQPPSDWEMISMPIDTTIDTIGGMV